MTTETPPPSDDGPPPLSGEASNAENGEVTTDTETVPESSTVPESYTQEELEAMLKADLLTLAESLGVTGVSNSNTKAEIIEAILAAQNAEG